MCNKILLTVFLISLLGLFACSDQHELPFLGPKTLNASGDTVYHQIPAFRFLNQDSIWVTEKDMAGKIYVADFFFTTCPTICPKMKTQLLRIYERYATNDAVRILSHSIDPEFDNVSVLRDYANKLHVAAPRWNLVTGDKKAIYTMARKSYLAVKQGKPEEQYDMVHTENFVLVDSQKQVRGFYDGTKKEEVKKLIEDIQWLLTEDKN